MKKIVFYLILLLIILITSVSFTELLLRITKPKISYKYMPQNMFIDFYAPSERSEYTLKQNYYGHAILPEGVFDSIVETNSLGWRDSEPDKRNKILIFGDSFTFGFGVNNGETIPDHLEKFSGGEKDFINLGFSAGGSPDSYAVWLRYTPSLQKLPTVVIIYGNDLGDLLINRCINKNGTAVKVSDPECENIYSGRYLITSGSLKEKSFITRTLPMWIIRLLKRSHLVGFTRDRIDGFIRNRRAKEKSSKSSTSKLFSCDPDLNNDINRFYDSLNTLKGVSGPLMIVLLDKRQEDFKGHFYGCVESYAIKNKLPYVIVPDFDRSYYFKRDPHYNQKGTLKAAQYIYKALQANGWIK